MADPNRIGGARGADGRTLTDVYDQLGALTTVFAGPNSILSEMRQYLYEMNLSLYAITSNQSAIGAATNEHLRAIRELVSYEVQLTQQIHVLITTNNALATTNNALATTSNTHLSNLQTINIAIQRLNDYIVGTGAVQNDRGEDFYGEMLKLDQWLTKLSTYIVGDGQQVARGEDFYSGLLAIKDNIGENTGDATTTLLGLLGSVQYALTQNPAALTTLYSMIRAMTQSLTLPANIDNTVLGELDALRVQMTLTNAILRPTGPTDCASPFVSNAIAFSGINIEIVGVVLASPATFAVWPTSPPSGLTISNDLALGNIIVSAADWSQWQIYVASRACSFGVVLTSSQRFDTNRWITLSGGDDFRFFVNGNDCLDVYLCGGPLIIGGGSPPTAICPPAANGVQWNGFVQRGTKILNFQERAVFAGAFSAAPAPFTVNTSTFGAWNLYTLTGSQQLIMCLSWDFSDAPAAPIAFTLITTGDTQPDGSNWGESDAITLGDMTKGCATYNLDNSSLGSGDFERFYFAFAFPIGTVPGGIPANVWLSIGT